MIGAFIQFDLLAATGGEIKTGFYNTEGAQSDYLNIEQLIECLYEEDDALQPTVTMDGTTPIPDYTKPIERAFELWGQECRDLLENNWSWVEVVAEAALKKETLTQDEIDKLRPIMSLT